MAVTDATILQALQNNPNATPKQIQDTLDKYGVSQERFDNLLRSLDPQAALTGTDAGIVFNPYPNTAMGVVNPYLAPAQGTKPLSSTQLNAVKAIGSEVVDMLSKPTLDDMLLSATTDTATQSSGGLFGFNPATAIISAAAKEVLPNLAKKLFSDENKTPTVYNPYRTGNYYEATGDTQVSTPDLGVSGTGGTSGVPAGADIFSPRVESTIPTPEETFKELEKEQQVARVQQVLANNPDATEEQIKTVIEAYDIPAEVLTEATGQDSVKGYVEKRDAAPDTKDTVVSWPRDENGNLKATDLPEGWVYPNERGAKDKKIISTTTHTNPDGSTVIVETDAEGNRYERWGNTLPDTEIETNTSEVLTPEERKQAILDWIKFNPNVTLDVLRTKMKNKGVTDQDIIDATGKTPEEIAGSGDTGGGTPIITTPGTPTVPPIITTTGIPPNTPTGTPTGTDTGTPTGTDTGNGDGDGNGNGEGNGNGGGMLVAALSPDRTTSEVLAPDLFKLDNDIPLIGRVTQNTPMAAPQYLLSGISQRYRV